MTTIYNSSDVGFSICKETSAGTLPASPAFQKFEHLEGSRPTYTSGRAQSQLVRAGRMAGPSRKIDYSVGGNLATYLANDPAVYLLMSSALSNTWVAGEDDDFSLKGGASDQYITIEEKFGGATPLLGYYKGVQVSAMTLSSGTSDYVSATFDIVGTDYTPNTSAPAGATYLPSTFTNAMAGSNVHVTIAGLPSVKARSFELKVEQTKEILRVMGSTAAVGVGTAGSRTISGNIKFYRTDMLPETLFTADNKTEVKFEIVSGDDVFEIVLPAASLAPNTEVEGASLLVNLDFVASGDPVLGYDIMITRFE